MFGQAEFEAKKKGLVKRKKKKRKNSFKKNFNKLNIHRFIIVYIPYLCYDYSMFQQNIKFSTWQKKKKANK